MSFSLISYETFYCTLENRGRNGYRRRIFDIGGQKVVIWSYAKPFHGSVPSNITEDWEAKQLEDKFAEERGQDPMPVALVSAVEEHELKKLEIK